MASEDIFFSGYSLSLPISILEDVSGTKESSTGRADSVEEI